jgi:hypothetical protein
MTISIIVSMASLDRVGACVSLAISDAECIVHIKEYSWSRKEALGFRALVNDESLLPQSTLVLTI